MSRKKFMGLFKANEDFTWLLGAVKVLFKHIATGIGFIRPWVNEP